MKTKYKIFIAKILFKVISLFGVPKIKQVVRGKINWKLDLSEGIDLSIFIFGNFEKDLVRMIDNLSEKKDFDIIDIGSNIGVHTLQFAKKYKNSNVYSIEPTDFAFNKLQTNINLNNSLKSKIKIYQYFVSNKKLPSKIYSSWSLSSNEIGHNLHKGILKSTNNCKTISLDDFISQNNIKKDIIIKCDVDGYELDVFKSGENYLKKNKPQIIMELAPYLYKERGYSKNEIFTFFQSLNYTFYDGLKFNKIDDLFEYSSNIKDGSSKNIFIK